MKTRPRQFRAARSGMTLVEIMITITVMGIVMAGALSLFSTGSRAMYKDMQRLSTDAALRKLTLQVAKETIDSSEFYVFPSYAKLDGSVNLTSDVAQLTTDAYGTQIAHGDCLLLVTRVNVDVTSNVRQFRIYYRATTNPNNTAAIRYYESQDYGASGTATSLVDLLNALNLASYWNSTGRQLVATSRGRPITTSGSHWCPLSTPPYSASNQCTHTTDYYPIFCSESATVTATNESVSINVEIINGTSANNLLSSSSFNFTISPRR
jgi:prepilin-type N-terminal cleavage/methylation domain-containing protein